MKKVCEQNLEKKEKFDEKSKVNLEKKRKFQEDFGKKKRRIRMKKKMKKISRKNVFS